MAEAGHFAEVRALIDFAEGRTSPRGFEALLYGNPRFEEVLGDSHLFVLQQNYNLPSGVLNAHAAVCDWLRRRGHSIEPTDVHTKLHLLLLRAQPRWLDVPMEYLAGHVLPAVGDLSRPDLTFRDEITGEIHTLSQCD